MGTAPREAVTDPNKKADFLSSVLFNVLVQMTKGPVYIVTRTTPDDDGFEALRLMRDQLGRAKQQSMISAWRRIR